MLGIDRLGYWAKQYGFGAPTGVDLPGEVAGIVPTNAWKQDALGAEIFPGETYQAGIGQGYDAVTPLQLINAYAALANGGKLYQPQIVREVVGPDGTVVRPFEPKVLHKLERQGERAADHAQRRPRDRRRCVTPTTSSTCPIKMAGKSGTAEFGTPDARGRLPYSSFFVGFTPKDARTRIVRQGRFAARRHGLRPRLADRRQRRDRDREVLPPAALRDQEGLPHARAPRARQLLPERLMGVIRAEPVRVTDWAAKSVGAAWRAFDLQLATYAGLLAAVGLVMAYTNSVENGVSPLDAGTTFTRGLMWAGIAAVAFILATAFDYRWFKTLVLAGLRPAARACSRSRWRSVTGSADPRAGSRSARSRSSSASSPRS